MRQEWAAASANTDRTCRRRPIPALPPAGVERRYAGGDDAHRAGEDAAGRREQVDVGDPPRPRVLRSIQHGPGAVAQQVDQRAAQHDPVHAEPEVGGHLEEVGPVDRAPLPSENVANSSGMHSVAGRSTYCLNDALHGVVVLQPAQRVVDDCRGGDDVAVVADVVLEVPLAGEVVQHCPRVSEASGDISRTAAPCSAMFRVAATSQRHDQVTRRIHRLHAMQPIVIAMSTARAIGICCLRPRRIWQQV